MRKKRETVSELLGMDEARTGGQIIYETIRRLRAMDSALGWCASSEYIEAARLDIRSAIKALEHVPYYNPKNQPSRLRHARNGKLATSPRPKRKVGA